MAEVRHSADASVMPPVIAIIDGPVSVWPACIRDPAAGAAAKPLTPAGGAAAPPLTPSPAAAHAQAMADALIASGDVNGRDLLNARVFDTGLRTGVSRVVSAIDDLLRWPGPIDLVLCAFGLPRADPDLLQRLDDLTGRVGVVVASSPARGALVWPAAHVGVISVQGDARCAPLQWSALGLAHADFGADPSPTVPGGPAGSSLAAARFAGLLLARVPQPGMPEAALAMIRGAHFRGRERRR